MPPPRNRVAERVELILDEAMKQQAHLVLFALKNDKIVVSCKSPASHRLTRITELPAKQSEELRIALLEMTEEKYRSDRLIAASFKRMNPLDSPGVDNPMLVTAVIMPQGESRPGITLGIRHLTAAESI